MTQLTHERMSSFERWTYKEFTLASGTKAWKNAIAAIALTTGKVQPGDSGTGLFVIGKFAETVDATAGDLPVNVNLCREIEVEWWENSDGVNALVPTDLGSFCYVEDDQTVTADPTGKSLAGRVWAVHATRGVAVERLGTLPAAPASLAGLLAAETALSAFSSNNIDVPDNPTSGAILDVPATAAASTITLPATAVEGTILRFVADGTKNGHTVTYRDATGPTNLTTALTASKRHMVTAAFLNGTWTATAHVGP